MNTRFLLALSLAAWPLALRAETDLQTSAYRNSIAQDEVRKQAQEVRDQMALLLEDIQQNQMDTPEFALARQTAAKLATLSDEEIAPLVQMLKDAGTMTNQAQVEGKLADASKEQKNVQLLLKTLSDALTLHKDEASMQQRFEQLVLRQTTNLRQTQDLAAGKRGKVSPELAAVVSVCQTEQTALRGEVDLAADTLQKVVNGASPDKKAAFAAALEEMKRGNVQPLAVTASDATTAEKFSEAAGSQEKLRDGLQAVLLKLKANQAMAERVQALASKMKELAATESQLGEATKKAEGSAQRELREAQAAVADQLAAAQKELQDVNAGAAAQAAQAAAAMQKAADSLKSPKDLKPDEKKTVAAAQEDAAKKLEQAGKNLSEAADKLAQAQAQAPQNAAQAQAALNQLSQQVAQAQAQASVQATNPSSPANTEQQKQQLADKTAALQQQALPLNPEAAKSLGQAAAQMQAQNPQAAAQALAQAGAQLQQQQQALAQAAAQQQALQAVSNQVAAAKAETNQAQQTMQGTKTGEAQSAAMKQTEEAQKSLQQAQQAAAGTGATPPDVKQALQQAQQALDKSKLDAAQLKKGEAVADNAKAQQSMQQAMQSLQQASSAAMAQAMPSAGQQAASAQSAQSAQNPQSGQTAQNASQPGQDKSSSSFSNSNPMDTGSQFLASSGPQGVAGQVVSGLKPKDREAASLLQKEKAPPEYQGMAQQYLKNLAAGDSPAAPIQ